MAGKRFAFCLSLGMILLLTCWAQVGSSPSLAAQAPALTGPGVSGSQAGARAWHQAELDGLLQQSSLVLWGSVDQADSYLREDARGRHIYTRVSIWPKGWALGALAEAPVVFEVVGGTAAGMTESVSDVPSFRAGAEVIVFLTGRPYRLLGGRDAKLEVSEGKVYWGAELPVEVFLEGVKLRAAGQSAEALWERESPGLEVAAAGPFITSITPSKASAGTQTQVVIDGSGFGTRQGYGAVQFFACPGRTRLPALIISWSTTRIICTVPVGPVDNEKMSAGSGPVTVRTSLGTSNGVTFRVTFGYGLKKWRGTQPTVPYYVNENTWDCAGEAAAIQRAANSWNAAGANLKFQYMGSHTNTVASQNFRNELLWGSEQAVGRTYTWSYVGSEDIVECDTVFSNSLPWSTGSSPGATRWDVESVALHEMGHWLLLQDLYGDAGDGIYDENKVMYGVGKAGEVQRTLHADDQAGIRWIYPPGPGGPFRVVAGTGSAGANPFSLVQLQTSPVREVVLCPDSWFHPSLDCSPEGVLFGASTKLRRLDATTCQATEYALPGLVDGIAFHPNGTLYVVYNKGLYTMNLSSQTLQWRGDISGGTVWGIDFAPDGTLYGAFSKLFVLDPASGSILREVGSLPGSVYDIDFAPDGYLYAVDHETLYQIDPASASVVHRFGPYSTALWGVASQPLTGGNLLLPLQDRIVPAGAGTDPAVWRPEIDLTTVLREEQAKQAAWHSALAKESH